MVCVLSKDFDWEVKVKAAQFWSEILRQLQQQQTTNQLEQQQTIHQLQQHHLFTALRLGLTDYEASVQAAFRPLLTSLAKWLPELRASSCDHSLHVTRTNDICDGEENVTTKSKRPLTNGHLPDFFEEDVDSVIEDIVMAEDRGLVAELEKTIPAGSLAGLKERPSVVTRVSYAQLQEFCQNSVLASWEEDEAGEERPEARLESVLDDILQSVEGVSLIETVDCY